MKSRVAVLTASLLAVCGCALELVDVAGTRGAAWMWVSVNADALSDGKVVVRGELNRGRLPFGRERSVLKELEVFGVELAVDSVWEFDPFGDRMFIRIGWEGTLGLTGPRPVRTTARLPILSDSPPLDDVALPLFDRRPVPGSVWRRGEDLLLGLDGSAAAEEGVYDAHWQLRFSDSYLASADGLVPDTVRIPASAFPSFIAPSIAVRLDYDRTYERVAADSSYSGRVFLSQRFQWVLALVDST